MSNLYSGPTELRYKQQTQENPLIRSVMVTADDSSLWQDQMAQPADNNDKLKLIDNEQPWTFLVY